MNSCVACLRGGGWGDSSITANMQDLPPPPPALPKLSYVKPCLYGL